MQHALTTTQTIPSQVQKYVRWFFMAIIAGALHIFLHEVAHYSAALVAGAENISFHWAYVDHDPASVSAGANAAIALIGPLFTDLTMLLAWGFSQRSTSAFLHAWGFTAAFRNLAVLPFTIKILIGADTSTFFFDEVRGASALGISPLYFTVISLALFFFGIHFFSRNAKLKEGRTAQVLMIVGTFVGIYLWSVFGAMLFPGGHGIN